MSADEPTYGYVTQSAQPETIDAVRDALHQRLDRNYGDTVGLRAGGLADEAGANSHVVGQVLKALATGEADAPRLDVRVWSRQQASKTTRWEVQRVDGGGR